MQAWIALECLLLLATFGGIVWGVLRFFVPPSQRTGGAALLSAVALVGFANQVAATWHAPNEPGRAVAAIASYLASMGLFWSAIRACSRRRLTAIFERDAPTQIVMEGPYCYVRHPFYTSYSIFWVAGWLGTGQWSTAVVAVTMIWVYVSAARREEAKFAASPLAATYRDYQKRVGFFLPRVPSPRSLATSHVD